MSSFKSKRQRATDLIDALGDGIDLTERDKRLLDWLAGWDQDTTDALADLIRRARLHHALSQRGGLS